MRSSTQSLSCNNCSLKISSVFKACPGDILDKYFANKQQICFAKDEVLLKQEENFSGVYCVQEGVVKITKTKNHKKEFILWFARPGDIIGLDSFINNESYSFSAIAVDSGKLCFIPAKDFSGLLSGEPVISFELIKSLCRKINFIEGRITSIAQKNIKEQFAEMLISLAAKNKGKNNQNIQVEYTIKDLANIIGTTKNYLYKILSEFTRKDLIEIEEQKLKIKNLDKLSLIAMGEGVE